jgi:hypothetical protein
MNELIKKYEEIENKIFKELRKKEKWGYTCSCEEKNVFIYTTIDLIGIPYCVNCGGIVDTNHSCESMSIVIPNSNTSHNQIGIPEIRKKKHAQEIENLKNSFKKYKELCKKDKKEMSKKEKEMEEAKARYNRLLGDK